jgi:NADH:ubiquinone oxidoreductase subunit 5 (subunit L)/multisubunit Na+/H+ antiporter MnhA subunit
VTEWFQRTPGTDFLLMLLGAVTIVGAVLMALVQHDLKRLLGMHAVSQVGYMVLAIGTGSTLGIAAGLFHMLNNAIYKSCLFLGAGVVEQKTGTVDLDRLGGLASRMPVVFTVTLIASLSISGIPPFNGFASKWMIYQSIIESGQSSGTLWWCLWLTAAMLGSALTLASFVKVLHCVFLCKPSPEIRQSVIARAEWPLALPMVILAGLCVVLGVFGRGTVLRYFIEPAVGQSLEYAGTWLPAQASMLMVITFGLGWLVYAISFGGGRLRRVPTYVGGENLDETRIPGIPRGASRHIEVTGVDFYQSVEQLPGLGKLYRLARAKAFDLYEVIGGLVKPLTGALRTAHQGVLPLYLGWFLLGLLAILYVMMERSS